MGPADGVRPGTGLYVRFRNGRGDASCGHLEWYLEAFEEGTVVSCIADLRVARAWREAPRPPHARRVPLGTGVAEGDVGVTEEQSFRCPRCGALAAAGAEWCGQCFARLGRPAEPTVARSAPQAGTAPEANHPNVPPPPMPVPPGEPGGDRDRRVTDERRGGDPRRAPVDRRVGEDRRSVDGRPTPASLLAALWEMPTVPEPERLAPPSGPMDRHPSRTAAGHAPEADEPTFLDAPPRATWPCAVCDTPNDLERDTCASCGAPFSRLFQEPDVRPEVDPKKAFKFSLIFPGLGHAVAGRKPEGAARAILFVWCAATALLLLLTHPVGGLGMLAPMAVVFVLGSIVWYLITAVDAYRVATGDKQLVSAKVMLYSVAALMMLSVGSVFLMVTKVGHLPH